MSHQPALKKVLVLIPLVMLVVCLVLSTASAQTGRYAMLSSGIGGEPSSGGQYSLVAHITQPDETMSGGTYQASGEFQVVAEAVIRHVHLPVVLRGGSAR